MFSRKSFRNPTWDLQSLQSLHNFFCVPSRTFFENKCFIDVYRNNTRDSKYHNTFFSGMNSTRDSTSEAKENFSKGFIKVYLRKPSKISIMYSWCQMKCKTFNLFIDETVEFEVKELSSSRWNSISYFDNYDCKPT